MDLKTEVLSEAEAKTALRKLPYRYVFRKVETPSGAMGALAGRVIGPYRTTLHFGIALGRSPDGVAVPNSGTEESYGYPDGGFLFTDDLQYRNAVGKLVEGPQLKTPRQWNTAIEMEVEMTDRLCKAATGEPCPPA